MLSKTSQYALRAVLYLTRQPSGRFVRATDVAAVLDAPANYLSKILHTLGRIGLLASERGPHGGFQLARPPEEVTIAEVIEPFEALKGNRQCLLGRPQCRDSSPCAVHEQWKEVSERMYEFFRETTVAELMETAPTFSSATLRGGGNGAP